MVRKGIKSSKKRIKKFKKEDGNEFDLTPMTYLKPSKNLKISYAYSLFDKYKYRKISPFPGSSIECDTDKSAKESFKFIKEKYGSLVDDDCLKYKDNLDMKEEI